MKGYHDIAGDGGSRVVEQVVEKRSRITANLAGVRRILAIGSGKGGVGKSTLTMQLACALRGRGLSVAILDADLNGPSQARLAGLHGAPLLPGSNGLVMPRTASGIGVISMGVLVPESEAVDFESVARGESYVWRATKEFTVFGDLLAGVDWGRLDFLLVDLPPGSERTFQYAEYLGADVPFVLVTVPSDVARGVVSRTVAALTKTPNRLLGYVENMSGYYCAGCEAVRPLFPHSDAIDLGLPCLGAVPFDPELAAACDRGDSTEQAPERPAMLAIREVTAKICHALEVK